MSSQLVGLLCHVDEINKASRRLITAMIDLLPKTRSDQAHWAFRTLQEYDLRGGKRLRGALSVASFDDVVKGESLDDGMKEARMHMAVALELMHDYLLIIDDYMDRSSIRRGAPTVHELYLKEYAPDAVDTHEADSMAVNVGLIAQHISSMLLAKMPVPAERATAVLACMHQYIAATGLGQIDDVYQKASRQITTDEVIEKYHFKSSYYTFVNPIACGLALAGRLDEKARAECEAFGLPAGAAFQLHDDYLGIFGASDETGKASLDDIREGKYTLLMQYAFDNADKADALVLKRLLGNEQANDADLELVRSILKRTGAADFVRQESKRYAALAKKAAAESSVWSKEFAGILTNLVDFSVERTK